MNQVGGTNGDTAGLESADRSRASDHRQWDATARDTADTLRQLAREARDEGFEDLAARFEETADRIDREVPQRSLDGENPQAARQGEAQEERLACKTHKMVVFEFEGRLSCGCPMVSAVRFRQKPAWLIEGRATMNGQLV